MPLGGHENDHKHHQHRHTDETLRSDKCYKLFDLGFLEHWKEKNKPICKPQSSSIAPPLSTSSGANGDSAIPGTLPPGSLQCRVTKHPRLNAPTAPHTICDGTNVLFDPSLLGPAKCLRHRPNYMCGGKPSYHHYARGAFKSNCQVVSGEGEPASGSIGLHNFPADHLKDIFDSFAALPTSDDAFQTPNDTVIASAPVTMFVTREKGEHVNMYHTLTDWYMAWQTLRVIHVSPDAVQVILLDNHSPGPLDSFWNKVISRGAPMLRSAEMTSPVLMPRVAWNPPGYSNMLLGKNWNDCQKPMRMMEAFVADVDDAYEGAHSHDLETMKVLFISRRPYVTSHVDHKFVGRQIDNEEEVIKAVKALGDVEVSVVDFAHMKLEEQVHTAAASDIIIGMHGAALAHSLWLPSWGGLVEMGSRKNLGMYFHKIARWAGIHYENWINPHYPGSFRKDSDGDYTSVDMSSFLPYLERTLAAVQKRKRAAFEE